MRRKNDAARTPRARARAPELMMIAKKNHLPLIHRLMRKAPLASVTTNARKS
jgi:hypothetical protein